MLNVELFEELVKRLEGFEKRHDESIVNLQKENEDLKRETKELKKENQDQKKETKGRLMNTLLNRSFGGKTCASKPAIFFLSIGFASN